METKIDINYIEGVIGYTFDNKSLLKTAFTHSSYANEHDCESNQRLEFLGDSVVDCIIGDELFCQFSHLPEGKLTVIRANIVSGASLGESFMKTGLVDQVAFGKKSYPSSAAAMKKLYADLFEAVIGAVYLDCGRDFCIVRDFVLKFLSDAIVASNSSKDAKSQLISYCQKHNKKYDFVVAEDVDRPSNDPLFTVNVVVEGVLLGVGSSRTKKEASQIAAHQALSAILAID